MGIPSSAGISIILGSPESRDIFDRTLLSPDTRYSSRVYFAIMADGL